MSMGLHNHFFAKQQHCTHYRGHLSPPTVTDGPLDEGKWSSLVDNTESEVQGLSDKTNQNLMMTQWLFLQYPSPVATYDP